MSKKPTVQLEEDLDDLDDILEQFNRPPASKPHPKLSNVTSSSSKSSQPAPPPPTSALSAFPKDESDLPDDFAAELARGMESLMRELGGPPNAAAAGGSGTNAGGGAPTGFGGTGLTPESIETLMRELGGPPGSADNDEVRKTWEKMIIDDLESGGEGAKAMEELFAGLAKDQKGKGPGGGVGAGTAPENFQDTIKAAMDKLKQSDDSLKADAAAGADPMAALFSSLADLNLGEGAAGEDGDLQSMLETMMSQLMSKEILYEPLKELDEKFPDYLEKNSSTIKAEDKERYTKQQTLVKQILAIFDAPGYSDDDTAKVSQVLTLMHEMQNYGSPPSEIMGQLPPGFELGEDGLPQMPGGCTIM